MQFQALLAIGEVTKQIIRGSSDFFPIKPMDYGRFLVISLGTGSKKAEGKYRAQQASKWGLLDWLTSGGSTPIIDVFSNASADMVDVHLSVVFQALHSEKNYLRIQVQIYIYIYISFRPSIHKKILQLLPIFLPKKKKINNLHVNECS